jgi:hypothetical protein
MEISLLFMMIGVSYDGRSIHTTQEEEQTHAKIAQARGIRHVR